VDKRSGVFREVREEGNYGFDISTKTKASIRVEQMGCFLIDLSVRAQDRGVYFSLCNESVGRRSALAIEISAENSITSSLMGVSAFVGLWIVISNFKDLLAIVIEEKAVYYKPNLAWDSQKGGLFVRHGCCRRK
jgi:hypothetical protein